MNNFLIAQIIFIIASLLGIIGIQQKRKRNILVFFALSTLMAAAAFIFLKAYSGSISLFMMSVFAVISYQFDKKERAIQKPLVALFIIVTGALGSLTIQAPTDLIPIAASICYVLAIVQEQEKYVRLLTAVNLTLWVSFDCITLAYAAILTDGAFAVSTIVAIVRYDILSNLRRNNPKTAPSSRKNIAP